MLASSNLVDAGVSYVLRPAGPRVERTAQEFFRRIYMGQYTLFGLLSPLAFRTSEDVSSGCGGIVYRHLGGQPGFDGVPDHAIPVVSRNDDTGDSLILAPAKVTSRVAEASSL